MNITLEKYLSDPCGTLAIPYWKNEKIKLPDYMKIVNNKDYDEAYKLQYSDALFFRLIHRLYRINDVKTADNYLMSTVDINNQIEKVVHTINSCYTNISVNADDVSNWTKSEVFDNQLWVYIKSIKTNEMVALGIAEFHKKTKEGSLEWIQVMPDYQGKGFGQAIVNELLHRMKDKANFVTVSGEVDNKTNPEALYRKCGFEGSDIWHIMTKLN